MNWRDGPLDGLRGESAIGYVVPRAFPLFGEGRFEATPLLSDWMPYRAFEDDQWETRN